MPSLSISETQKAVGAVRYVERTMRVLHSSDYRYVSPVRDVMTRLRLFPPVRRGQQRLVSLKTQYAPLPSVAQHVPDRFGNEVWELHHETVREHLTLVVSFETTNGAYYDTDKKLVPVGVSPGEGCPPEGSGTFLQSTGLTEPNVALEAFAQSEREQFSGSTDMEFVLQLCQHVYAEMQYKTGSTTIQTTAAQAWETKRGVCQDFAHILIALYRLCGFPARYASGFLPGEGAMHAWVEVLVSRRGDDGTQQSQWLALDPTHQRWVNERYVTVAVGRDYRDITPSSGTFYGKGPNVLLHKSKVTVGPPIETATGV